MRLRLRAALAASALLFSSAALAQDAPQQTVEGAQEFLRLVSSQFSLANSPAETGENYFVYTNLRFEPFSVCVTNLTGELKWRYGAEQSTPDAGNQANMNRYKIFRLQGMTLDAAGRASWDAFFNSLQLPTEIDWASVSSVETKSTRQWGQQFPDVKRAVVVNSKPAVVVVAPDAALAARIAYAMEFLRAACDKSAETGF